MSGDSAHIQGHSVRSLYADHQNLCKFSGFNDQNYRVVLMALKKYLTELQSGPEDERREKKKSEDVSTAST